MANLNKVCINCGKTFLFTPNEQDFYREHGYVDPKRCYPCRKAYKKAIIQNRQTESNECFNCAPRLVRGVITDAQDNCIECGRHIEKSYTQHPVLAHHLRDGQAVPQEKQ